MKIEIEQNQGNIRIIFFGDMDEYAVRDVRNDIDRLIDTSPVLRTMVFDLRGVSFVDSTALGFLLARYKRLRARHSELVVANVPHQVDKVFKTSGIYRYVPIVE